MTVVSPFWAEGTTAAEALFRPVSAAWLACQFGVGVSRREVSGWQDLAAGVRQQHGGRTKERLCSRSVLRAALPDAGLAACQPNTDEIGDELEEKEFATRLRRGIATTPAEVQRALHAKMILWTERREAFFTPDRRIAPDGAGLGGPPNFEAGFVYRLTPRQRKQLAACWSSLARQPRFTPTVRQQPSNPGPKKSRSFRRF